MNRPVTLGIGVAVLLLGMGSPGACLAQTAAGVARERSEFAHWLASAPLSPYAMIALQPIGPGISVGPEPADIPLPLSSRGVVREERGVVTLELEGRKLALPRGRPVSVAPYRFLATGPAGRTVLAAYGAVRGVKDPTYFPFAPRFEVIVGLEAPERRGSFRTLGLDGIEADAVEAGFVTVRLGGQATRLRVYRIGDPEDEETGLQVFFRDATNGKGSYPAGRFVELVPETDGRYRLDFNRARNPFCAYSSAYPCPAPWPGNSFTSSVEAGERYTPSPGVATP